MLDLGESAVLLTLPPTNQTRAADIILIVDESSSMVLEHDWIPDMTQQLDTALQVMCYICSPMCTCTYMYGCTCTVCNNGTQMYNYRVAYHETKYIKLYTKDTLHVCICIYMHNKGQVAMKIFNKR